MPTIVRMFIWKHGAKYHSAPNLPSLESVNLVERLTLSRLLHFDVDRAILPRNAQLVAVHHDSRVLEFTYGTITGRVKEAYDDSTNSPTTDSGLHS